MNHWHGYPVSGAPVCVRCRQPEEMHAEGFRTIVVPHACEHYTRPAPIRIVVYNHLLQWANRLAARIIGGRK